MQHISTEIVKHFIKEIEECFAGTRCPSVPFSEEYHGPLQIEALPTHSWMLLPRRFFCENADETVFLSAEWVLYLLPAILTDALIDCMSDNSGYLPEFLHSLFCNPASNLSLMLSQQIRTPNSITEAQQKCIRETCAFLSSVGYLDPVQDCLEERFAETVHVLGK